MRRFRVRCNTALGVRVVAVEAFNRQHAFDLVRKAGHWPLAIV